MKLIHINEAVFNRLLEDNRRPPFQDFYDSIVTFIEGMNAQRPYRNSPKRAFKGLWAS